MPRHKSTLYRPVLGATYVALNTKTKEKVACYVLRPDDLKDHPVRSGRSCTRGEEYFMVCINGKIHKMNNSNQHPACLSEDAIWQFIEDKPSKAIKKISKQENKKIILTSYNRSNHNVVRFISPTELAKIQE
jgi:hypothetical protein